MGQLETAGCRQRTFLQALVFLSIAGSVLAQDDFRPRLRAVRAERAPSIDGVLDQVWLTADSAWNFVQRYPLEGEPATERTTVFVLCDDDYLYVAFRCHAESDQLVLKPAPRDTRDGDNVGLLLDTFDDQTTAYYFGVTSYGVEYDARVYDDGRTIDPNWDGNWCSAVRVADYFFCVEIRIPFSAIRFPAGLTEWGVNFERFQVHAGEQSDWAPQKNNTLRVSRAGKLEEVRPRVSAPNLDLLPSALAYYDEVGDQHWAAGAGLDVGWHPGSATSVLATVNPDLARTENVTWQVLSHLRSFPADQEPLFSEAGGLFRTDLALCTPARVGILSDGRVIPMLVGGQVASRGGRLDIGVLGAVTRETEYTHDPLGALAGPGPLNLASGVRLNHGLFDNSQVGLLYAGKDGDSFANHAVGVDAALRHDDLELNGNLAWARYRGDATRQPFSGSADVSWQSRYLRANAFYLNAPMDFAIRTATSAPDNRQHFGAGAGATAYRLGFVRSVNADVDISRLIQDQPLPERYSCTSGEVSLSADFKHNWTAGLAVAEEAFHVPLYSPQADSVLDYNALSGSFWFQSDPSFWLNLTGNAWYTNKAWNYRLADFTPEASFSAGIIFPALLYPRTSKVMLSVSGFAECDSLQRMSVTTWYPRVRGFRSVTKDFQIESSIGFNRYFQQFVYDYDLGFRWNIRSRSRLNASLHESYEPHSTGQPFLVTWERTERVVLLELRYLFHI